MDDVEIAGDGILLGQLLKFAGVVVTGGEARMLLADGLVRVNGEPEERRGRQLRVGDVVTIEGGTDLRVVARGSGERVTPEPRPVALIAGGVLDARALVAERLAADGWSLTLNYPSGRRDAEAAVQAFREGGTPTLGLFARLDEEGTGRVLVGRTMEAYGRLDAVVIDPPPAPASPFGSLDDRYLEEVVAVRLLGAYRVARAAVVALSLSRGRLVVVARGGGSAGGLTGGGLAAWAAALGEELAEAGIAVGCVATGLPGAVPAAGLEGEPGVAEAVLELLRGARPAPGVRVDVAAPLSSRP